MATHCLRVSLCGIRGPLLVLLALIEGQFHMEQDWVTWWAHSFMPRPASAFMTSFPRTHECIIIFLPWKVSTISCSDNPGNIN